MELIHGSCYNPLYSPPLGYYSYSGANTTTMVINRVNYRLNSSITYLHNNKKSIESPVV